MSHRLSTSSQEHECSLIHYKLMCSNNAKPGPRTFTSLSLTQASRRQIHAVKNILECIIMQHSLSSVPEDITS
eukprot:scaffold1074_cov198-Chaetoceros_neogracile.AAC.1